MVLGWILLFLPSDVSYASRELGDIDYFLPSETLGVALDTYVTLRDQTFVSNAQGTEFENQKATGLSNSLTLQFGLNQKVNFGATANYFTNRKSSTSTGTVKLREIADPEFFASCRVLDSEEKSTTVSLGFSPSLVSATSSPQGPTKGGKGYGSGSLKAAFAWREKEGEYLVAGQLTYRGEGGVSGIGGNANYNFQSTVAPSMSATYQYKISNELRIRAGVVMAFPYTVETEHLTATPYRVFREYPTSLWIGVGTPISLSSDNSWALLPSILGSIKQEKTKYRIVSPSRNVTYEISNSSWEANLSVAKIF